MSSPADPHLSRTEMAKLSALADGTLDPAQRTAAEAWIGSDPRLGELYERERAAVERVQEARASSPAPAGLRERIAAGRRPRPARNGWRTGYAVALGSAVAAVAIGLGLTLPGGGPGTPSVAQASTLALRGPAQPAPGPNPRDPGGKLDREVQDIYFPNWSGSFGWRAVGQRVDRLGQRRAVTIYYTRGHASVAYTIVGAGVLPEPSGPVTSLRGYRLHTLSSGNRTIVTWRRDDHTCVLSASGLPAQVLQRLAAWHPASITE
ncbi:MAG TPA: hypothetical protein VMU90_06250 [Solirubrobacteraceae bacterium]|nr:hypothetical protein [Solirubrobacteraceae bacterium]